MILYFFFTPILHLSTIRKKKKKKRDYKIQGRRNYCVRIKIWCVERSVKMPKKHVHMSTTYAPCFIINYSPCII